MKTIDQIIEELQQIGIDIPEYIQSGKPENVKAANHRSLETRMNNAILDLVEHIKNLDGDRNVIVGEDDPNTTPPIGAIVGSLYLQKNAAGDNLALYINTGTAEVGWFLFREYTEESKIYGDAPNPNFESIPGKVGDLYIQTNDGTSTGDIISVWMYVGLATGDLWINISAPSGSFNITTKTLTDGQVYNFPQMEKGEAFIIKIMDEDNIPAPSGAVWLGGYGGVLAGDGTLVICLTNSPGGSFADVGHQFVIINQGKNSEVIFVDELPDENLARTGVIYVLNSNNAMYIWDQQLGDYVLVGDVIPGTLISNTEFRDENNNVVVPEANKLYFDTTTEIYYRWNGSGYAPLITLASEAKWGDITGDIQDQEDLIALVDEKLDKPLSDGTFLVKKNGLAVTYFSADGFGQNIANTDLTTTAERTFTQGFIYTHQTDGKIYNVKGLPNKNVDESFRKFRVQDANGQQAIVDKKALYDTIEHKAISSSVIEPDLIELNAFNTERVDYPNLNRIYFKNGFKWTYIETIDVV